MFAEAMQASDWIGVGFLVCFGLLVCVFLYTCLPKPWHLRFRAWRNHFWLKATFR